MVFNVSSYQAIYDLYPKKIGLKIDQPDASRGTRSTENVARRAFSNELGFIECMLSLVAVDIKEPLSKLYTNSF